MQREIEKIDPKELEHIGEQLRKKRISKKIIPNEPPISIVEESPAPGSEGCSENMMASISSKGKPPINSLHK